MKHFFAKAFTAIVIMVAAVTPAQAQFRWGIKAGSAVNTMKFNKNIVNSDNRAGFTGGLMIDFTAPLIGVGMDASVLYAARSVDFVNDQNESITKRRSYIDIPINFKYKLGLPLVGKFITPFVTTGPTFRF